MAIASIALIVGRIGSHHPFLGAEPRKGFSDQRVSYETPVPQTTSVVEFRGLEFSAINHNVVEDENPRQFKLGDVVEFRGIIAYSDPKDAPFAVAIEVFEPTSDGRRKYGSAGGGVCNVKAKQSEYSVKLPMPDKPGKYTYELRCSHPSNLAKAKLLQRGNIHVHKKN